MISCLRADACEVNARTSSKERVASKSWLARALDMVGGVTEKYKQHGIVM
jgi:hypothetical protein